jgi:hypothetical protein
MVDKYTICSSIHLQYSYRRDQVLAAWEGNLALNKYGTRGKAREEYHDCHIYTTPSLNPREVTMLDTDLQDGEIIHAIKVGE